MKYPNWLLVVLLLFYSTVGLAQNGIIVFQSDFGLKDGAVSTMKGVAVSVTQNLKLYDLTHEIPAYNIWEAAYRLGQTVPYWPEGTVFVSVVDPGVGTDRQSVVVKTKTGHYIVTPDNGTLTLIANSLGIEERREINEAVNRRQNSGASYTFHGRDVYAYTAARLASKTISFAEVGNLLDTNIVRLPYQKAIVSGDVMKGTIEILDVQYGNLWTNIPATIFDSLNVKAGQKLEITIRHNSQLVYKAIIPYVATFGAVGIGKPLIYLNSLLQVSVALNQKSFADVNKIGSGAGWHVEMRKVK